jgi:hypothetical protein
MSDEPAAPAAETTERRHYRYIGETDHVMPDLVGRERCCQEHNQAPHAGESVILHMLDTDGEEENLVANAIDPHVLLRPGDVILLDPWSGDGRADFELAESDPIGLDQMTVPQLREHAASKGIEVPKSAPKPQLLATIRAAEASAAADTAVDDTADTESKEA